MPKDFAPECWVCCKMMDDVPLSGLRMCGEGCSSTFSKFLVDGVRYGGCRMGYYRKE
jgi:hypothetical protein